jgi:hypothetical protein
MFLIPEELKSFEGARELLDWFGEWPGFHDAEILRFDLRRDEPSRILIHTWRMTKQVDAKGFFQVEKNVVVEFVLEEIFELNLVGEAATAILFALQFKTAKSGIKLEFDSSYGFSGLISAKRIKIVLHLGKPAVTKV